MLRYKTMLDERYTAHSEVISSNYVLNFANIAHAMLYWLLHWIPNFLASNFVTATTFVYTVVEIYKRLHGSYRVKGRMPSGQWWSLTVSYLSVQT